MAGWWAAGRLWLPCGAAGATVGAFVGLCCCQPGIPSPLPNLPFLSALAPAGRSSGSCRCCTRCRTCRRRPWARSRGCPLRRHRPTLPRWRCMMCAATPAHSSCTLGCPRRRTPAGAGLLQCAAAHQAARGPLLGVPNPGGARRRPVARPDLLRGHRAGARVPPPQPATPGMLPTVAHSLPCSPAAALHLLPSGCRSDRRGAGHSPARAAAQLLPAPRTHRL